MLRISGFIQRACATLALLAGAATVNAAKLDVDEGVVVKFGTDAGLAVYHRLSTGRGVVFTSINDDSIAGATLPISRAPAPGDWRGVSSSYERPFFGPPISTSLGIDGLDLRYAGGADSAALDIVGGAHFFSDVHVTRSTIGMRLSDVGDINMFASFQRLRLHDNAIGIQASRSFFNVFDASIAGNTQYGVENASGNEWPFVSVMGTWWGHASGPKHPQTSPTALGDTISDGVSVEGIRTAAPLYGCTIAVADGNYVRTSRTVEFALSCPPAVEYRLSETVDFGDAPFAPIVPTVTYTPVGDDTLVYAQFRAADGGMTIESLPQRLQYVPGDMTVAIATPAEGATLGADAPFTATTTGAVATVDFFVGDESIGTDTQAPYEATIAVAAFANGDHTIKAVARGNDGTTVATTRAIRIDRRGSDPDAPTLTDVAFGGTPLNAAGTTTLTAPGQLTFATSDASTVVTANAKIDGQTLPGATFDGARYAAFVSLDAIANGAHTLVVDATDAVGNTASVTYAVAVDLPAPPAPVIVSPVDGTVGQTTVAVSGTAQPGSKVQLYLNGNASGPQLVVGANGVFGASVTLAGEGGHQLHATASSSRGASAPSVTVLVNYVVPPPTVLITSPADAAVLANDVDVNASVIDPAGVASVAFTIGNDVVHTATQPPYTYRWALANVADGEYTIAVTATSSVGKTATASRIVFVEKEPPPPEPPQTPYTGQVQTVTPATSYGEQDVVITGRSIERAGGMALPNSLVRLVLSVGGFQRKINVVTDAAGAFRFVFKPQASDAGVFGVSANHPDEPIKPAEKTFTITRFNVSPADYRLNAARTVSTPVRFTVSSGAGAGISGFRFVVEPEDQTSGAGLPNGIGVVVPPPQDIPANGSAPVEVRVLAAMNGGDTGTIVLTAYANDSGSAKRAKMRIHYSLRDPQPALSPSPPSVSTGVKRGAQVAETINLKNSGALPASGVTATLVEASSGAGVPAWISLGSPGVVGDVGIGETKAIQIVATPPQGVTDGVYRFNVRVASTNAQAGDIPVSVAVTDAQVGSVAFQVEDIYTDPLGKLGPPVLGVAGASVRVQNENVLMLLKSGTTDANGRVRIDALPIGNYAYRVSAPNHADAAGRILVKPVGGNGTDLILENVFLDYELVSFEWSVTETTIQDRYDVTLNATYHTNVPAPVVVIEPASINVPDLQQGEEFTGEFTITNYGLIRADNVRFTKPNGNNRLDIAFVGDVPSSLAAKQRVTIGYKITARQAFPGDAIQLGSNQSPVKRAPLVSQAQAKEGGCNVMRLVSLLKFDYECVNGTLSTGSSAGSFDKIWGDCGTGVDVPPGNGGDGGGDGGWPGGWYGPAGASINPPGIPCVSLCLSFCCAVEKWFPGASEGKAGTTPGVLPAGPFPLF